MKTLLIAALLSFGLSVSCAFVGLPILRKIKAGQTVLGYVKEHKHKNGTPTMGGLLFILPSVIIYFIAGQARIANVAVVIGIAFMLVGFIDDFIKIKLKHNEGLKPYQKIIFQLAISLIAGVFCYQNGITVFHLPFVAKSIDLQWGTIPLVAVIFIATTNCVNLTDGLDGLASSVSIIYFVIITVLIGLQVEFMPDIYLKAGEYQSLRLLSICLSGGILAFLLFNVNKASVFMGDTGSLSLGGFIAAISIFSSNSFFIPIIGIMFVLSGISVIMQVLHYKRTKKRIFLMAPLHHHFQLKGNSETQISYGYLVATVVFGALSLIAYA